MLVSAPHLDPLTDRIIGAAIKVHSSLGPGLLESAYQVCLEYELARRKMAFERQVPVPVVYDDVHLECGYRLDLVIEERVIVEVKATDSIAPIHVAQMITYLKLTKLPVGLILNFNTTSLRQGIRRVANRDFEARRGGS
jgi:GxxExxY protein